MTQSPVPTPPPRTRKSSATKALEDMRDQAIITLAGFQRQKEYLQGQIDTTMAIIKSLDTKITQN